MAERRTPRRLARGAALAAAALLATPLAAEILYKYRGPDGEWMYTDRPPPGANADEVRPLGRTAGSRTVSVQSESDGESLRFIAQNSLHAPVEATLRFTELTGLAYPDPDRELRWVLAPNTQSELLALQKLGSGTVPAARYTFDYRIGDPGASHRPPGPYRVPFAISSQFTVTQAYPDVVTHTTEDSRYAIDVAMPVGTDVFAARAGIVFDVSTNNFRSGLDPERDGPAANVVQVLHDDGTYAVYAHLNWNSIRVAPGDRVKEGEYIADSGNTGYSSGPHLHFVVLQNDGRRTVSVPLTFRGADRTSVVPATGALLTAY